MQTHPPAPLPKLPSSDDDPHESPTRVSEFALAVHEALMETELGSLSIASPETRRLERFRIEDHVEPRPSQRPTAAPPPATVIVEDEEPRREQQTVSVRRARIVPMSLLVDAVVVVLIAFCAAASLAH